MKPEKKNLKKASTAPVKAVPGSSPTASKKSPAPAKSTLPGKPAEPRMPTANKTASPQTEIAAPKSPIKKAKVTVPKKVPVPAPVLKTAAALTPPGAEPQPVAPPVPAPVKAVETPVVPVPLPITKAAGAPKTKKKPVIPAVLLEGDETPGEPIGRGPGRRFELGTPPAREGAPQAPTELPEAYGTGQIFLSARDPHWLYASWDFTLPQLRDLNRKAKAGHLTLRTFLDEPRGKPAADVALHPESLSWFVHVPLAERKYVAELGYTSKSGDWVRLGVSRPTVTPPESISEDTSARFSTIPEIISLPQVIETVKELVGNSPIVAQVFEQLREFAQPEPPTPIRESVPEHRAESKAEPLRGPAPSSAREVPRKAFQWTEQKAKALADLVSLDKMRRVWMGSLEITELLKRNLKQPVSSIEAAGKEVAQPTKPEISSLEAARKPAGQKGFWFNVNAELVIYGATEKDATLTVDGRPVRLRPDGTFSFRFSLPDGDYELPLKAVSFSGDDQREARLQFSRATNYKGDVKAHPQDQSLKPPKPDNVQS